MEDCNPADTTSDSVAEQPLVVAVLVTHDPGEWFAETLRSLAAQDYPNLRLVVLDADGQDDPTTLVRTLLPRGELHHLLDNVGFGPAVNEVLRGGCAEAAASGAAFFLLCHDDVVLEPPAVSRLVETVTRYPVDVVGPKLVDWDEPGRLLQMGEAATRTATAVPLVEPGEIDQGQHDGLREVFAVPSAVTLIRAGLFRRIGGYDDTISMVGENLSLCWRARLAGGRVAVTSAARVRHRQASDQRLPQRQHTKLGLRHRLRILLTCCNRRERRFVLPAVLVMSLLRSLGALLTGRLGEAWSQLAAWPWNLARPRSLWIARRQVKRFRRVGPQDIRALQVSGLTRLRLRRRRPAGRGLGRGRLAEVTPEPPTWTFGSSMVALGLAAILALGSRHLLTRGVPQIGQLVGFGSVGDLLGEWRVGWRRTGLGSQAPVPTLLGAVSGLGAAVGGHMALLRTVLTVGLLPVGVIGAFRVLRHRDDANAAGAAGAETPSGVPGTSGSSGSWRRQGLGAALAYAALPIPYMALATGRWDTLAVYGAAPWLLAPFLATSAARPDRYVRARQMLGLGLVTALLAMVVPTAPVLLLLLAAGLVAGSLLAFDPRPIGRLLLLGLGGVVVSAALHLPWTVGALRSGQDGEAWWGLSPSWPRGDLEQLPLDLGSRPSLWALLGAATLPLLVGRGWRLTWAVRGWVLAAGTYGLAWAQQRQAPILDGVPLPRGDLLLVLAGLGVALAVGSAVAAVELDVIGRSRRFGFRRLATGLATLALAGAMLPTLQRSLEGDWGMPGGDFTSLLSRVDQDVEDVSSRVLWVGHPDVLPGDGWRLDGDLAYATSLQGYPSLSDLLPGPANGPTRQLGAAIDRVRAGETSRLGRELAPMAVQYVAVPLVPAPSSAGAGGAGAAQPPPQELLDGLAGQLDLERVAVDPSLVLYRNLDFLPTYAQVRLPGIGRAPRASDPNGWPTELASPEHTALFDPQAVSPALAAGQGGRAMTRAQGPVGGDTVLLQSAAESPNWALYINGVRVERRRAFGWANAFVVAQGGEAELRYETPWRDQLLLVVQMATWLAVLGALAWLGRRSRPTADAEQSLAPAELGPDTGWLGLPEDHEYVKLVLPEEGAPAEGQDEVGNGQDDEDDHDGDDHDEGDDEGDDEDDDEEVEGVPEPVEPVPVGAQP